MRERPLVSAALRPPLAAGVLRSPLPLAALAAAHCPAQRRAAFSAAYHEAGHIVGRLRNGLSFRHAFILPDGSGVVTFAGPTIGMAAAVSALAGPVSEWMLSYDQRLADIFRETGFDDWEAAQAALRHTREPTLRDVIDITHRFLAANWPAVTAIAAHLQANGEIAPAEAAALL
jgi:hypothetical protein